MWPLHSFFTPFLVLLLFSTSLFAAFTNTTIDDADSSFTFTSTGAWNAVSPTDPCTGCTFQPDPSQTYQQTWHDGHYGSSDSEVTGGSFTFTGSAVYIFGIDQANTQPNIVFTLGSLQSKHHYTGSDAYVYNALFFSATGLSGQTQTVSWVFEIDPDTGLVQQVALFDYAIVTNGTNDTENTPIQGQGSTSILAPTKSGSPNNVSTPPSAPTTSASTANGNSPPSNSTSSTAGENLPMTSATSSETNHGGEAPPTASTSSSGTNSVAAAIHSNSAAPLQSSSNRKPITAALVGSILGALFACSVTGLVACWRRRRHRKGTRATELEPTYLLLEAAQSSMPLNPAADNRYLGSNQVSSTTEKPAGIQSAAASASPTGVNTSSLRSDRTPASQSTTRERRLEDRVAQLEARIEMVATDVQPPPYACPD